MEEEPIPEVFITPGPRFVAEFNTSNLDRKSNKKKRVDGPFTALEKCMRLFILLVDAQTDSLLVKKCGGETLSFVKTPSIYISSENGEVKLKPNAESALKTLGLSLDVFAEENPKVYLYADLVKQNVFVVVNPYNDNWLMKLDNPGGKYDRMRIKKILKYNTLNNEFDTIHTILEHVYFLKKQSQDVRRKTSIRIKLSDREEHIIRPSVSDARMSRFYSRKSRPVAQPTSSDARKPVALTAEQKRQLAAVENDVKKSVEHIIRSVFRQK